MRVIFLLLIFATANMAQAQDFNLGVGFIHLNINHYRGSDQRVIYNFPVPYLYYDSDHMQADSAVISGKFFTSRFLTLQLSLGAGPAIKSDTNEARHDMPDLRYNAGIGPMLIFHLIKTPRYAVQFEFTKRQEFETDFKYTAPMGYTDANYLTFKLRPVANSTISGEISFGNLYANQDFHKYYYEVATEYATTNRPEYVAKSGPSGKTIIMHIKKRVGPFLIMPFLRYDDLSDAKFADSPLVKQKHYLLMGTGIFLLFF